MPKNESKIESKLDGEKKPRKKSSTSNSSSGPKAMLRSVVGAGATDTLLDLVERLGIVDLVVSRVKSRIEETDLDDVLDEVTDYLRRNPEVLVVSLGAVTIATGLMVWLNNRREWDGNERRDQPEPRSTAATPSTSGRPRRASTVSED